MPSPPRLAEAILERSLSVTERDEILGDMSESYVRRARAGRTGARLWYWRHALGIAVRLAVRGVTSVVSANEFRHSARSLLRSPVFTLVAIVSLGVGIGASAAIFSVVRSVLFTPLAVERPGELRLIYYERPPLHDVSNYSANSDTDPVSGATIHSNYSYSIYRRLRDAAGPVPLVGFNLSRDVAVVVEGRPALSAAGMMVSGDFFSTLRPRIVAGRPFDESDDRAGAARVAVITHAFWQRAFGAEPKVVGRTVRINGTPFQIVGVTGADFDGLSPAGFTEPVEIIAPFSAQEVFAPRWNPPEGSLRTADDIYWVRMMARVPDGVVTAPVEEAMTAALRASLLETSVIDPEDVDRAKVHFVDGSRGLDSLRGEARTPLSLLAVVVAAVLLIACVNLASLMLARGAARRREFAVRRALGAGRLRLMSLAFVESLMLAGCGGVLGLLLTVGGGPIVTAALTSSLGRVAVRFQLDWKLLGVIALVSLLTALLCGVLPALRLTRGDGQADLRSRVFGADSTGFALGPALIAVQIAISIPLVVGAGLFLRTLGNLAAVDLGFDAENLVVFRIDPTTVSKDDDRIRAIFSGVLHDLEQLPGVSGATLVENALLTGWISNSRVSIDGEQASMYMNAVGPRYFEIMGIPLLVGRAIRPADDARAAPVVVVNQTAENHVFGGNALGRTIRWQDEDHEVVGVVADSKYDRLRGDVTPTFYDPYSQRGLRSAFVVVRTTIPVHQIERPIREIVGRVDPGLPVEGLLSETAQIRAATHRERVFARLLSLFAVFALLIASIGLYGVTSFAVARRRPEMGVRLALGARPPQILWLVLRSVLVLVAIGVGVGLVAAYLLGPVVDSMLYGLESTDESTLLGAALVMVAVAIAAGWIPALRAARTDALTVLTSD